MRTDRSGHDLIALIDPTVSVILYGAFALFWVIESSVFGRTRKRP